MRSACQLLQCLLLAFIPCWLHGQEVNARARVDSTHYLVGDAITVHIDVTHAKGVSLKLVVADTLAGFAVLDRPGFSLSGETSSVGSLIVARYDSGVSVLPPLEIVYSQPGDTSIRRSSTNPLLLTIHTLPVDTSQAFRDLKPVLSIPLTLAEIALYIGIALLVVLISYFGYRYWKKRKQQVHGEAYVPPPRPAHIIALEELARLKEKRLWQQGHIKQYYSEASEIIRRFIENRFRLMALEQTTDEIMDGLKRLQVNQAVCGKVETLLRLADLVKFAKYQPGMSEHEEALGLAFDIVESTRAVEVRPAVHPGTHSGQRVVAHVES